MDIISRLNSAAGITEILKGMTIDEYITKSSELFELPTDELSEIDIECFGAAGRLTSYRRAVGLLFERSELVLRLFEIFSDETSLNILIGMIRYWLLPDPQLLNYSGESDDVGCVKLKMRSIGDIKKEAQTIHDLRFGEELRVYMDNVLPDLFYACELISSLNHNIKLKLKMSAFRDIYLEGYYFRYAPEKKLPDTPRVAAIARVEGEWRNQELLKDFGLVPYILHKNHGCDSVMVGEENPLPYAEKYLKGMRMEFLPDGRDETKLRYMEEHAGDIDILAVYGMYPINYSLARIYKRLNPNGRIYLALDANLSWMDRINIRDERVAFLPANADVIGSSGRYMQEHLNRKWPWRVEHFSNGYFHPWVKDVPPEFEKKENIILTVARVGIYEKANDVMLDAFVRVADRIPDWKLRIVGGVDPAFEPVVRWFYETFPKMRDRVEFAGQINDKEELCEEYRRAKIFTLTSRKEGTPNVISEALHLGCALAITKIDEWREAIDDGNCGMAVSIDDSEAISGMYLEMCQNEDRLRRMCENSYNYAVEHYSMENNVAEIFDRLMETARYD